jgi:hypothetical protein
MNRRKRHKNPLTQLAKKLVARGQARDEDDALVQIINVFAQFMRGQLRPVDAATETKILDAQDRAFRPGTGTDAPALRRGAASEAPE